MLRTARAAARASRCSRRMRDRTARNDDEAGGVEDERPADAVAEDQQRRDHRPDDPRAVEDQRVDPDRGRQVPARNQARHDGEPERLAEGEDRPADRRQHQQDLDGDRAGQGEPRERRRLHQVQGLHRPERPQPVHPVGHRAGDRREQHGRKHVGEGDDAEPGARMGELPGEPADRHPLYPGADVGNHGAAGEQPEVAMRERASKRIEAG